MFVLVCHTKVFSEKASLYESTFRELAIKVRDREPGVLFYELSRDHQNPGYYILVEAYADQATQDVHMTTDYYKEASAIIHTCIDGEYDVQVYETIGH